MLNLPIPFDPAGVIPEPVNAAYNGAKWALAQAFNFIVSMFGR
jgi:hypothetical protein